VVATSYLLGVSTRRVEKLLGQLGIASLSKSQVWEMVKSLDAQVEAFRSRPLDAGPYTFLWLDALTRKVRESGRTVIAPWSRSGSPPTDNARSSAWTWSPVRTGPADSGKVGGERSSGCPGGTTTVRHVRSAPTR
jgi:hypothetical protein